jgi:hypothetical protein
MAGRTRAMAVLFSVKGALALSAVFLEHGEKTDGLSATSAPSTERADAAHGGHDETMQTPVTTLRLHWPRSPLCGILRALRLTRRGVRQGIVSSLSLAPADQSRIAAREFAWEGRPFAHLESCPTWPHDVAAAFRRHNAGTQEAYAIRVAGRVTIDGPSGFAVHGGHILPASLAYAYDARLPSWRTFLHRPGADVVRNAISLRDPYETNYFHFFNDLLGKVLFVRQHLPESRDHVFVVAEPVYKARWFQALLSTDLLRHARFVVQRRAEPVVCENAVFIKAPPHQRHFFTAISASARSRFAATRTTAPERLVLVRGAESAHGRIPANQRELAARLAHYGFEAVDPGTLPWPEQVSLIRDCRVLVGAHGAGLTNMMFRGEAAMEVIELFPRDFFPPHYYWMADALGYGYQPVAALSDGRIDVEAVVAAVQRLD